MRNHGYPDVLICWSAIAPVDNRSYTDGFIRGAPQFDIWVPTRVVLNMVFCIEVEDNRNRTIDLF
jgi:hypothetical protein